jgi:simple sugar transport system permease protein
MVGLAVAALWVLLHRSRWGLELRAAGDRPLAARASGVAVDRVQTAALLLSGALAGMGGAVELAGITHRLFERFSPGYGYSGIATALLGGLAPGGTAAAALLFGAMAAGSGGMQRVAGVPVVTVLLIQGLVVVALAVRRGDERP